MQKRYTDKGLHKICEAKEKYLTKKFLQSFLNKNNPIIFIKKNKIPGFGNNTIEKDFFIYYKDLIIGSGHFSKCFYGIELITRSEIAIKFALNNNRVIDYKKEGQILCK